MLSVIVPAHNEENVIARCLSALLEGLQNYEYELIVVCNGCSDRTAEIARTFRSVDVLELSQASKVAALNRGVSWARGSQLAFVDADVELKGVDLIKAVAHLSPLVKVVAPQLHVELHGSSLAVKSFYWVWTRLPYFSQGQMVGSGVFILSEAGKQRVGEFPQLIADDGYVRALFGKQERMTATDCCFRIFAPRTLRDLVRIKTRVRLGNIELRRKFPGLQIGDENTPAALIALLVKRPWRAYAGLVYAWVQWKSRQEANKRLAIADFVTWDRDESSRLL